MFRKFNSRKKGDLKAFEAGWNWIRNKFEISDKYKDFKVLDLKTCQSIIKDLEAITRKLDIVNFK